MADLLWGTMSSGTADERFVGVKGSMNGMPGRLFIAEVPMGVSSYAKLSNGRPALKITNNRVQVFVPDTDTYGPVRIASYTVKGELMKEEAKGIRKSERDVTTYHSFLYYPPKVEGQKVPEKYRDMASKDPRDTRTRIMFERGPPTGDDYVLKRVQSISSVSSDPSGPSVTSPPPRRRRASSVSIHENLPTARISYEPDQMTDDKGTIINGFRVKPICAPHKYDLMEGGTVGGHKFEPQVVTIKPDFGSVFIPGLQSISPI